MSTSLAIFIIIHLAALIYFVELLRRTYVRSHDFDLREDSSTLPFGFLRLRHIVILYVVLYLVWVFASFILYFTLISPSPAVGPVNLHNINLNW
jgi:hypothetical protein